MRVKVKKRKGESNTQLLKRFLTRFNKSGVILELRSKTHRTKKLNERAKWERKMYRLKLQQFIKQKMKEGWPFNKAYKLAKRYVSEIKYTGQKE